MAMLKTVETTAEEQLTIQILEEIFEGRLSGDVGVRLWNGRQWPDENASYGATIVLNHPGALRAMFLAGNEKGMAEAYIYNDVDIEGDFDLLLDQMMDLRGGVEGLSKKVKLFNLLRQLPVQTNRPVLKRGPAQLRGRRHSIKRDREAIKYHYNVSNDFYSLWLDKRMVYSCAYFKSKENSLEEAQTQKLDYICRKLRLKPGQKLLDIGCGWGGLAMYAAQNYGVEVTGITISQAQLELANKRVTEAGLNDRVKILGLDYREINEPEKYDVLVSVGMFEHVGEALLPTYFEKAYKLLKPGGVFLNHGIATGVQQKKLKGPNLMDNYIFPDGELVPVSKTLTVAENCRFEVRDVESLRDHYMLTLQHWLRNLEMQKAEALKYVEDGTFRLWRLYLASCAYGFKTNQLTIYQSLLAKPDGKGRAFLPLTREDWYR